MQHFQEFWPFYLKEHSSSTNRNLHFIGTSLVIGLLAYAVISQKWLLLWIVPVAGYSFAWVGHFFVERNKPATFRHPLWSLIADFKMWFYIVTFRLKNEYVKFGLEENH